MDLLSHCIHRMQRTYYATAYIVGSGLTTPLHTLCAVDLRRHCIHCMQWTYDATAYIAGSLVQWTAIEHVHNGCAIWSMTSNLYTSNAVLGEQIHKQLLYRQCALQCTVHTPSRQCLYSCTKFCLLTKSFKGLHAHKCRTAFKYTSYIKTWPYSLTSETWQPRLSQQKSYSAYNNSGDFLEN